MFLVLEFIAVFFFSLNTELLSHRGSVCSNLITIHQTTYKFSFCLRIANYKIHFVYLGISVFCWMNSSVVGLELLMKIAPGRSFLQSLYTSEKDLNYEDEQQSLKLFVPAAAAFTVKCGDLIILLKVFWSTFMICQLLLVFMIWK